MKTFTVDIDFIKEAHEAASLEWKEKIENQFPEAFKREYPKLMINNGTGNNIHDKGMLVFMTAEKWGNVVYAPKGCYYSTGIIPKLWDMNCFDDYKQ